MINNVPTEGGTEVNNELANRMSLFYAEATPTLKTLSDTTTKFVSENKNLTVENTTDCLSPCQVYAESCWRHQNTETDLSMKRQYRSA